MKTWDEHVVRQLELEAEFSSLVARWEAFKDRYEVQVDNKSWTEFYKIDGHGAVSEYVLKYPTSRAFMRMGEAVLNGEEEHSFWRHLILDRINREIEVPRLRELMMRDGFSYPIVIELANGRKPFVTPANVAEHANLYGVSNKRR